jgi:hypothetical protein
MNNQINPKKAGFAVGGLLGGFHLAWAIVIAIGWAQALLDFSLWVHMVSMPMTVQPFNLSTAVALVVVTWLIGYVLGSAFACIWNRTCRGK